MINKISCEKLLFLNVKTIPETEYYSNKSDDKLNLEG